MDIDSVLVDLVDLHQHLGSSSTPHFLWELAHEQGISLAEKNYWKFIDSVTIKGKTTYKNYLKYFDLTEVIQSSPYAVERAVHNAISLGYRKANTIFSEIRFNPMFRNKKGEQDLDKIILSSVIGMKHACLEYPVRAGIILIMDRRLTRLQNEIIAKKAVKFAPDGVVGLDLAGPLNDSFKIEDIVEAVNIAKAGGLKVTIHTGEVTSVGEIWDVVRKLEPDRIGHGIRSVDDPKLLNFLAERGIVLEVCPTSNIMTKAVKDWEEMRDIIIMFKKFNVAFTINSDGPVFLRTNVKQEFKKLYEKKILTLEEIASSIKLAKNSTFIH